MTAVAVRDAASPATDVRARAGSHRSFATERASHVSPRMPASSPESVADREDATGVWTSAAPESVRIVNLMGHDLTLLHPHDGAAMVLPNGGRPLRLRDDQRRDGACLVTDWEGETWTVPVVEAELGGPNWMPPPQEGVIYVVSKLAAQHPTLRCRRDIYFPVGIDREHDGGRVIGCKALARFS